MGVPAFFRWLSRKYPSIVVQCDDGVKGEYHFDNLYLDMNGIIHPCSHPENKPPPANEDEMFMAIFEYVEDIMQIVKPKKLLYMAVDGVAPRAKMNQQRSRRFRAAQESYEKMIEVQKVKDSLKERGIDIKEKEKVEHFDSNVITPGTDFMVNLSEALRSWINRRLSDDFVDKHGIWPKDLVIILSDASVPGEGEHKIMDYIRKQKADSLYNPNLSHCLYGADADLIMLGLATHEPNFTILREEFKPNQPKPCDLCGQLGHELKDCTGEEKAPEDLPIPLKTDFIYIRLNVLREYLEKESQNCSVKLDFERFIDDYVFLCFFVGNDFLPHLPSLEIRENAIDRLINIYKYVLETASDSHDLYLTKDGIVNKPRAQCVLKELGEVEDEIFKLRQRNEKSFRERNKRRKLMRMNEDLKWLNPQAVSAYQKPEAFKNAKEEASKVRMTYNAGTGQANERLNSMLVDKNAGSSGSSAAQNNSAQQQKGTKRSLDADSDSEPEDLVQLHTEGWKERYYMHKFDCNSVPEISRLVANEYFKGLCWVLLYYYQGCPDWKWFFPYHYAPFASDFHDVEKLPIEFDGSAKPFRPMEQLMSVFPAASSKNLPPSWRLLMTTNSSPIIDFYPTSFRIDLNGKKAAWMGVALLPFIDEDRLFRALSTVYDQLTESEKLRNSLGAHLIFVSKHHPLLTAAIQDVINSDKSDEPIPQGENAFKLMAGKLSKSALYSTAYKNLMCCEFSDPQYEPGFIYPAKLLANAKIPDQVLRPNDISQFDNYRPQIGMNRRQNQAYLDRSGHRTVERSVQREYQGGRERTSWHNQYGYDQNPNYRQGGGGNRYPQNGANRGGAGSGGGYRGSYSNYNDRRSGQGGGGGGGSRNNYQSSNRDPRAQGSYQQQPSSNYASHSYYQSNHNYYQQQSYGQPQSYGQHSYGQAYQQHQQYGSRVQYPQAPPAQPAAISSYYSSDYAANPPQQPPVGNNGGQSGIYRGGSSSSDKYRQQNYKRY